MPTVLRCAKCGAELESWPEVPYDISSGRHPRPSYYHDVFDRLRGKCPKCGRKLPDPTDFLRAMQIEVKPNSAKLGKSPLVAAFRHDYHKKAST